MASIVLASLSTSPRAKRFRLECVNDENIDPNFNSHSSDNYSHDVYDPQNYEDHPFIVSVTDSKHSRTGPDNPARRQSPPSSHLATCSGRGLHHYADRRQGISDCDYEGRHVTDEYNTIQVPTPQTPRHRDALSKKVPITPRRITTLAGKSSTPRTPRTPVTPFNLLSVYHTARQLFVRSAHPGRLVGREAERKELQTLIQDGSASRSGRCLYVSGPPGTGKSALVSEVCQTFENRANLRKTYVNCMSVKASGDVYSILSSDLFDGIEESSSEQNTTLRARLAPPKRSPGPVYLIVLDEIDRLLDLDLEILYTLFELALRPASRLVLIGIANALDLTDRFLPRLKARNLKPQLLPFLPYTAAQVASVITTKLRSLIPEYEGGQSEHIPLVHPTAIQFCSKKVASQTGDLRKAFDIIHSSLSLVENETKQTHQRRLAAPISPSKSPLTENPNLSSPSKARSLATSLTALNASTAPRVTIAHVARVSASALGNGTSQRLHTLNLQQKAALGALIFLEKEQKLSQSRLTPGTPSKTSDQCPTARDLYETYCLLCKRDKALHPLTAVEFYDVIGGLETLGLIGEGNARSFGSKIRSKRSVKREARRMSSWVSEMEFDCCLEREGGAILKRLLENNG
ncbi:MAG: hypothetical protein LQ337_003012 [Flavoplaca oasis]|nr:MAG: hypothetical protein LQ337_003012 [Flavoplaca oasis]